MWCEVKVTIREFQKTDIPKKVEWINNPENNRFLHYDLPLSIDKTEKWFYSHVGDRYRYDAIIEVDGVSVGLIGLLSISPCEKNAEYYIAMGESKYKGKGVAKKASKLIIRYGFDILGLNHIYLFTETENFEAQRLFESLGFTREGILQDDVISHGRFCDRYVYSLSRDEWETNYGEYRDSGTGTV